MFEQPKRGVAYGVGTDPQGRRGIILVVECTVNSQGTGKVSVTGAAKSAVLGPATAVEDVSVVESAEMLLNTYETICVKADVQHFEIRFHFSSHKSA